MLNESKWKRRLDRSWTKFQEDPGKGEEIFEELVTDCTRISTWDEFQKWCEPFKKRGCFRGQRDSAWHLDTTFYRKVFRTRSHDTGTFHTFTVGMVNPEENEEELLREFQQAAHHYYPVTPDRDQVVDWLALMQHHGAPTRMLDWTRSPYIALYFAMQEGKSDEADIWAIDWDWLQKRSVELIGKEYEDCPNPNNAHALIRYINSILLINPQKLRVIVPVSPIRVNERMLIQQGELLCDLGHGGTPLSIILLNMLWSPKVDRQVVSKVLVKRDKRIEFLEELRRMNIHEASLFPGLDGFARSLGIKLDISVANQIDDINKATELQYKELRAGRKPIPPQ